MSRSTCREYNRASKLPRLLRNQLFLPAQSVAAQCDALTNSQYIRTSQLEISGTLAGSTLRNVLCTVLYFATPGWCWCCIRNCNVDCVRTAGLVARTPRTLAPPLCSNVSIATLITNSDCPVDVLWQSARCAFVWLLQKRQRLIR